MAAIEKADSIVDSNNQPRVPRWMRLVYGSGDWGRASFNTLRQIFYAIFLTDVVGIDPRLASIAALVAILWDAINIGSWANQNSRSLPRLSRIFLYFGYVLLTVCAVNWALTSHNLTMLNYLTGEIAGAGFTQFGKPMLFAFVLVTLLQPTMRREDVGVGLPSE